MMEIELSTASQARDRAERIRTALNVSWQLIKDAYLARDWVALGYGSWDDYCGSEFRSSRIKLPMEERQEVVASMREIGMSTRAISSATGVSRRTLTRDRQSGGDNVTTSEQAPVTGTDGKTYTPRPASQPPRPEPPAQTPTPEPGAKAEPQKPRRTPITDDANRIGWEIRKATEKLESLAYDDRFDTNKKKMTPLLRGHLQYAVETAQIILEELAQED